jgi:drug/metabolite transporter (DMT)-like permease
MSRSRPRSLLEPAPAADAEQPPAMDAETAAATGPAQRPRRLFSYLALAGSVVGIGSAVIFIRLSEVDATSTLMLRMVVASMIIGGMAAPRRVRTVRARPSRRDLALLGLASVLAGLDLFANNWAVNLTSIASTVLLANLTPVFVLLIVLLTGGRVSRWQVAAVALAVIGAAVLMSGDSSVAGAPGIRLLGDGLALLSAVVYAVYIMMTKGLVARIPTTLVLLANSVVTAALLAPLAFATSPQVLPRSLSGYAIILGYALVSQLLGHGLLTLALRTVDATLASVSVLLRPLVSVVLGWLILGEALHSRQVLGGVIVLAALAWFEFGSPPDHGSPVDDPIAPAPVEEPRR